MRNSLIIDWASAGLSATEIVNKLKERDIPTSTKTVSKVLKNKGFIYYKNTHNWVRSENNSSLIVSNSIEDYPTQKMEENLTITSNTSIENKNQLIEMQSFSSYEFDILKTIISERINSDQRKEMIEDPLAIKIAKMKDRERKNKTYYLSTNIVDSISLIAEKNGVKISNVVEIALLEFIHNNKTK